MRALITRPAIDAQPLAEALAGRGFEVVIEPLLEIVPVAGPAPSFAGVQGVLATSANGVRALADKGGRRDLPLWAVGDATAAEARRLGFARVSSASGDVASLAELVAQDADPGAGALLHVAGSHVAGDLAGRLGAQGFVVRRAVLYEARAARSFSPALRDLLAARQIDVAFFFSPRTATSFVTLARSAALGDACAAVAAFALSAAVAEVLGALAWRGVRVAGQPTQSALLAALDADRASWSAKA